MIRIYDTLSELAEAIGWTWPNGLPDPSSPKKFRVADTEDECYRVHADGTRVHRINTETRDKWIVDFNTPRWSPKLGCMVTKAHYNRNAIPHLRGASATPQELADVARCSRQTLHTSGPRFITTTKVPVIHKPPFKMVGSKLSKFVTVIRI